MEAVQGFPFVNPWHFEPFRPRVKLNQSYLRWRKSAELGDNSGDWTILVDAVENWKGIMKRYSCILPKKTGDSFIVWDRSPTRNTRRNTVMLEMYSTGDLMNIRDHKEAIRSICDPAGPTWIFDSKPKARLGIQLEDQHADTIFPDEFKEYESFCIVTEIPGLYGTDAGQTLWNTAILVADPKKNTVDVYPQDWFNRSSADFGYAWITCAMVDPYTGRIHGKGIRTEDFELDETNRNLLAGC